MSTTIHANSIVSDHAEIAPDVQIGPFCYIGPNVKIGPGCKLHSHVVIDGHTTIGRNNEFYQFTSIGAAPQDKSYKGEPTKTIIGDNNIFREMVQVHRATTKEIGETKIGSNGYFMTGVHIAHDCIIGDNVTLASYCGLAGHVHLDDFVIMGGSCGATPFITVGKSAYIGGASALDRDIPPYCTAYGNRIRLKGINIVGLKRRGGEKSDISEIVDFFRVMESSALSPKAFVENSELMEEYRNNNFISEIGKFISESKIGIPPFIS